jgi:hypothetical protein
MLQEKNTLLAPPILACACSLAVGARHDAAVGRGELDWFKIARSTPPGVTLASAVDRD